MYSGSSSIYQIVKNYIEFESGSGDKLISTKCDDVNEVLEIQCKEGHSKYESTYREYIEGKRCNVCRNEKTYPRYRGRRGYTNEEKVAYVESKGFRVKSMRETKKGLGSKGILKNKKGLGNKMVLICPKGKEVAIDFTDFRRDGRRCAGTCTECGKSNGEIAITIYLDKKSIKYARGEIIVIDDNGANHKVEVDFLVYDENGILKFMIEFNGKEHYRENKYFGGKKALLKLQDRDKLREKYCNENEVTLIKIPYWDSPDIDEILDKKLDFESVKDKGLSKLWFGQED